MTHVLLMLCGHVQDKDLHMSHSLKELYLNFFFPIWKDVPPGMHLSLHRRSRFPWRVRVVCKKNLVSRWDLVLCKTWTSSDGCVGSSDSQDNHISFTPAPNLHFRPLLMAGMKVSSRRRLVDLGWVTYSIVWPHISIHEFLQMLPIHLAFRTA